MSGDSGKGTRVSYESKKIDLKEKSFKEIDFETMIKQIGFYQR